MLQFGIVVIQLGIYNFKNLDYDVTMIFFGNVMFQLGIIM